MSIRKRVWLPHKKQNNWILDYYDQTGKLRYKTFKNKRDAEAFSEKTQLAIRRLTTVNDEENLDFTIYQPDNSLRPIPELLTVKAIIQQIEKIWLTASE